MNRFLALAALFAGALAGHEDGGGYYNSAPNYNGAPGYNSATAVVSSFVAAPPMASTTQMANAMTSSTPPSWESWQAATPMAGAVSAAPSLITMSLVATPTASGWPQSPMATHTVVVGGSSLTYMPPSLSGVQDKDTIIFLFLQVNHTLTQSSFASPCNKTDNGFKSGFLPSDGKMIPFVLAEFSDPMNTGSPLWFYCGQANHCQKGMRFSINAPNAKDVAWRAIDTVGGTTTTSTMAVSMPSASIVPGTGMMNNGQCSCECLCGVNAFPAGDGMGMMGGMPGMIPAASAPSMAAPMSSSPAYSSGSGGW